MTEDRSEFIEAVKAQAWDQGKECPTCHDGKVYPGRRTVHCFGGGFGADWDEQSVIDLIVRADQVVWLDADRPMGMDHDLGVHADGKRRWFDIREPEVAAEVARKESQWDAAGVSGYEL